MALTDKLTAIGDAVRAKNSQSGTRTLPQLETDILTLKSAPNEAIPEYIYTEAKRLAEVVKSRQTANSVSFICCSDLHEDGTGTVSKHNAMAAYLVKKYAPIDFGVFLGDHIRGGSSDTEATSLAQYKTVLPLLAYWCDASVNGNHDNGQGWWDGSLSSDTLYQLIGRSAINVVRPSTEADRGYYYFDVPQKSFRVIMLNTNDLKGVAIKNHSVSNGSNDGHRVSVSQLQWFAQTLAAIPSGYKFIVCSHEPIHWYDYTYEDANGVTWDMAQKWRTILDAYVGGTSYSFTQDGQTVSGDFSNSNNGVLIGTFHGHTHNFIDGTYGDNDIIRISTPNGCNGRTNEYGNAASYGQSFTEKYGELDGNGNQVTAYNKTAAGTTNETAFVVNTIDFDNQVIYSDHYGAGRDRAISYGEEVYYNISKTLGSHAVMSNSATSILEGEAYSSTVGTDLATYSIQSVVVTMGGVDITSTAYSNGTISIASVTGNISITVTTSGYTNLANDIGYTAGTRISTSSGNNSAASGLFTTGYIPCSVNDVIRVYGYDFRASANGNNAYAFYDANKTKNGSGYNNEVSSGSFDLSFDSNGYITFVPKQSTIVYARFGGSLGSGDATGADLIITINEEII